MIEQCLNKSKSAITFIIDAFNDEKRVVNFLLILCFLVSFTTTYSGFVDLMGGWGGASFFALIFTCVITVIIQLMIIWLARRFWESRNNILLYPLSACVLVSVTMALACYFDILSLDKTHASNIYAGKLEQTFSAVRASTYRYQDLADKTQMLADYSAQKAQFEQDVGGTCDVPDIGRGPRTLYRENDAHQFSYYAKQFNNKSAKMNTISKTILQDFRQYDGSKIILLNQHLHQFNAVVKNKIDFIQLKFWLNKRVTSGGDWYDTGVLQFGKVLISCPDARIKQYYNLISNIKASFFRQVPTIDNIANPETPGTQVIQSFKTMVSLFSLQWDKISQEQWIALFIATIIDLIIFALAYTLPKTILPPAGSSWNSYLRTSHVRKHGQLIDTFRILSQYASYRKRHTHFFIPVSEKELNMSMQPLIAANILRYRRIIRKWQLPFLVPAEMRQGNSQTYYEYKMSVYRVSQMLADLYCDEEQAADNVSNLHSEEDAPSHKNALNGNSYTDFASMSSCKNDNAEINQHDKATGDIQ